MMYEATHVRRNTSDPWPDYVHSPYQKTGCESVSILKENVNIGIISDFAAMRILIKQKIRCISSVLD